MSVRIDDVSVLIKASEEPDVWLLDGLIEEGDQVVLVGAPKAGKSLMASQIALAVANGGDFLDWKCTTPRRVLYVNLELRMKRFGQRLIAQAGAKTNLQTTNNLLTVNDKKTINILNPEEVKAFAEEVRSNNVDLVIWDVLARMHSEDENNNPSMRAVMHHIRVASGDRAHIVIHHMRKPPSGAEDVNMGAAGIRGASSIHGEADLIMSLHVRSGQGARFSLKFSARNIEAPEEMLLDRDGNLLFSEASTNEEHRLKQIVLEAFLNNTICKPTELTQHLANKFGVKDRRAKQLIQNAVNEGWLVRTQKGSSCEYTLTKALQAKASPEAANQEMFDINIAS